jgi:CHAD domain-containing protein
MTAAKFAFSSFGLDGRPMRASSPGVVSLRSDSLEHLAESLKKQWKRYRRELRACQKHFSAEAVHGSRVATRRLLSTVELLAAFLRPAQVKKVQRSLKYHLDVFDDLRDTQVQLEAVRKLVGDFPAARDFRSYLRKREERFSRKTRKAVRRVKTKRLGELIAACRAEATDQRRKHSGATAAALLLGTVNGAFARTLKLQAQITTQDPRTIHTTRIAFKKFRYMVEALAKDLTGLAADAINAMHEYQGSMGEIQDNEVLLGVFDKFVPRKQLDPDPARRLRQELVRRRQTLIRNYFKASDQLLEFWPQTTNSSARRTARVPARAGV